MEMKEGGGEAGREGGREGESTTKKQKASSHGEELPRVHQGTATAGLLSVPKGQLPRGENRTLPA